MFTARSMQSMQTRSDKLVHAGVCGRASNMLFQHLLLPARGPAAAPTLLLLSLGAAAEDLAAALVRSAGSAVHLLPAMMDAEFAPGDQTVCTAGPRGLLQQAAQLVHLACMARPIEWLSTYVV